MVKPDLDAADANIWEGTLNQMTRVTEKQNEQLRKQLEKKSDAIQKTLDELQKMDKASERHIK